MVVTSNAKKIYFYAPSLVGVNAQVQIKNDTTKEIVFNKAELVEQESYYQFIERNQGFDLVDKESYIITLTHQGKEYRANLQCLDDVNEALNKQKRINSDLEYIKI